MPPAADAADFAFFALFRLNPVHILSGTADRREAPEGLSRILPGTLCRINLKIHRFISSPEGCKRPVVAQPHFHICTEASGLDDRDLPRHSAMMYS